VEIVKESIFFFLENKNVYLSYLITIIITSTSTIVLFLTLLSKKSFVFKSA
jgi:hypothetical protein